MGYSEELNKHTLFEYHNAVKLQDPKGMGAYLENLWRQQCEDEGRKPGNGQSFLEFNHKQEVKAHNYVGFISHGNDFLELYPKVFAGSKDLKNSPAKMLDHVLYWFSYCSADRFPYLKTGLGTRDWDDFPELIIYMMARQILEQLQEYPYHQYQEVEEALQSPKGRINVPRYARQRLARGQFHYVECDYEPFIYDNQLNRIIKYCARLLQHRTRKIETYQMLEEAIFILDEVTDTPCVAADTERIHVNPFFGDYDAVMGSCRQILNQQLYNHEAYALPQFSMLFPMEKIFEEFVARFLQVHFGSEWHVDTQKSDLFLAKGDRANDVFQMRPDVVMRRKYGSRRELIVDTKYKQRDRNEDARRGIVQKDMYQMLSYAYRRGARQVLLLYPNTSDLTAAPSRNIDLDRFQIAPHDQNGADRIDITAVDIPFWSSQGPEHVTEQLKQCLGELLSADGPAFGQ